MRSQRLERARDIENRHIFPQIGAWTHPIGPANRLVENEKAKWHIMRHFAKIKTEVELT